MAVAALELAPGDEVIMPALTIISCALSVVRAGAVPVLVDSDPATWNIKPDLIEEKITPRTKAIMPVHLYGLPADMDPILALAEKYGLKVIEDSAEAIGQTYKGRHCGNLGTISTFSFYPNKHVTTGEGGVILTNDEKLARRCRSFRNLCFPEKRQYIHEDMGWNYRMSNLQAALGSSTGKTVCNNQEETPYREILYSAFTRRWRYNVTCSGNKLCGKYLLGLWNCTPGRYRAEQSGFLPASGGI